MYVWKNSVEEERWNTEFVAAWRKFNDSIGLKMHPTNIDYTQDMDACEALDDEEYTLVDAPSDA